VIAEILRRGVERGELRADLDLDLATDMVIGPVVARVLFSGGDPRSVEGLPMRVWDALVEGMGA
jgi:hypothetical protein